MYYFTTDALQALFEENGFETESCVYVVKRTTNRTATSIVFGPRFTFLTHFSNHTHTHARARCVMCALIGAQRC